MFSQVSVCPQGGSRSLSRGSLSGGSLSRGVSVKEGMGLCPGVSVQGAWVSVQDGSLSGGSLSKGVSVQGGLGPGEGSVMETPLTVCILLECILVYCAMTQPKS